MHMGAGGNLTEDYEKFLKQPSSNYDDSGYFSIQVLQKAVESFNLDLIPYKSSQNEIAIQAQADPTSVNAYICNFKDHWYTIRKIGNYWFNLNSLFKRPQYISDTYLSILLAQLVNDGYSIFIINGNLPISSADQNIAHFPKELIVSEYSAQILDRPSNNNHNRISNIPYQNIPHFDDAEDDDDDLKAAIAASLTHDEDEIRNESSFKNAIKFSNNEFLEQEDADLKLAIAMSLDNNQNNLNEKNSNIVKLNDDRSQETNRKVDVNDNNTINVSSEAKKPSDTNVNGSCNNNTQANVDDIRKKRLEYLEKLSQSNNKS